MKYSIIITALLTSSLCVQAGITTLLRRFPKSNTNVRRSCQTTPIQRFSANDIVNKSDKMVQKHGTHLGYFLQHLSILSFDNPNQMMKYLDLVDVYAGKKIQDIPSPEQFVHFSRQQQEKE
jgi:hypothetical protein